MRALISAITLTALFCPTTNAAVNGWVEQRNVLISDDITPTFDGIMFKNGSVNTFCYFLAGPYSEVYVGPRYAPTKWVEIGAGMGIESTSRSLMKGTYVWVGHGKWSAVGVYERGASTFLKWEGNCNVTKTLTIGWWQQSGLGAGPRVQIQVPHTPFLLTGMRLQHGSIITVRVAL